MYKSTVFTYGLYSRSINSFFFHIILVKSITVGAETLNLLQVVGTETVNPVPLQIKL